jgi:glycine cleavage system transcriptional repressor
MAQRVMTAVGPDRPGLVGEVTRYLHEAGLNLADSRMINLRGQFAIVALVEGTPEALAAMERALHEVARPLGLQMNLAAQREAAPAVTGVPYRLKTSSVDQAGIVRRVTEALGKHGVNLEEVETQLDSAPFMGTPLFTLEIRMTVPQAASMRALRRDLEAVADAINCDIDLDPA